MRRTQIQMLAKTKPKRVSQPARVSHTLAAMLKNLQRGGFAEAVLLRRRYAVMKEAAHAPAADESATATLPTRGVLPPAQ